MAKHQDLIQTYGLFWDRRQVTWNGSGAGLYGFPATDDDGRIRRAKSRDDEVDLRGQVGVYALYDAQFRLLYVGKVGGGKGRNTLFVRLKQHRTPLARTRGLAVRWKYFSWFGLLRVLKGERELAEPSDRKLTTRPAILNALEAVVIEIAAPALNRQGGQLGGAIEYLQHTVDDLAKR